jgi:hypothetical protein
MGKEDVPKLTPGSKYRIMSAMTRDEPLVTEGTFMGYTVIGSMDALCMEVDGDPGPEEGKTDTPSEPAKGKGKGKGKKRPTGTFLRLIPGQVIIAVDILSQAEEKKREEPQSTSRYYY